MRSISLTVTLQRSKLDFKRSQYHSIYFQSGLNNTFERGLNTEGDRKSRCIQN